MYFQQKLRILTTLFKLSNSKLARGINVDASLVSRWKSGERKISPNSPHIPALATYFLRLNAYHYQKAYLDRVISSHIGKEEQYDDTTRIHVLADWLISGEPPEYPVQTEQANQLTNSAALIANMADLLSEQEPTSPASIRHAPNSFSSSGTAEAIDLTCEPLLFRGRAGRRGSVLFFLRQVLVSEKQLDLLLISEDDMAWLMEDPVFTREWALLLKRTIEAGHKITIVHVVNRQAGEIMKVLNYWMPLHLSGRINSFYYPKYIERDIRQTMFLARGEIALVSTTTPEFGDDEITYAFRDEASVKSFTSVYECFLKECRPLFSVYSKTHASDFYQKALEFREKGGDSYNIRHALNLMGLPTKVIAEVIDHEEEKNFLTGWLEQHQVLFSDNLKTNPYIDIYPYDIIEEIAREKKAALPRSEIFSDKAVYLSKKATAAWLKNLIKLLRQYDNYQIYFAPATPGLEAVKVNINYKENLTAMFSTELPEGKSPLTVILNEANILHALSRYFDDFIQKIPSSMRQKDEVIDRLAKLVEDLEN